MERGYVEKEDVPSVLENSQSITPEMYRHRRYVLGVKIARIKVGNLQY